jgi:hypothetical protein
LNSLIATILLPWLISAGIIFILFGWGLLVSRALKISTSELYFSSYALFGLIGLSFLVELLHIFYPINYVSSFIAITVGFLGIFLYPKITFAKFKDLKLWAVRKPFLTIGSFLILIYWSLRVTKLSTNFDTAAYHLQIIRWANEYPSIPGIANLWTHLALNQSYFDFLALLRYFPFFNDGYVLGALIFFMVTSLVLIERSHHRYINFAWIAFLFFLVTHSPGSTMFSPTPDLAVGFIEIIIFCLILDIFDKDFKLFLKSESVALILLLSCYLFTIKLTGLIFASIISLIILGRYLLNNPYRVKDLNRIMIFAIIFALSHIGNGYILSGYPLFPSTFGGLESLPWFVPQHIGQDLVAFIHNGTIDRHGQLDISELDRFSKWFPVWLKNLNLDLIIYISLTLSLLVLNIVTFFKSKKIPALFDCALLCLPPAGALIFWFNSAPEFRYAGAGFEMLIASLFLIFLYTKNKLDIIIKANGLKFCVIVILLLILPSLNKQLFSGWQHAPNVKLNESFSKSGVLIHIPDHELCWDAKLPCVYNFNSDLYLLNPNHLESGFSLKK